MYKDLDKRRAYDRAWHKNRSKESKARKQALQYKRRREIRKVLDVIKSKLICKCGENHIACLEFHHNNPEEKDIDVSTAISRGWSVKRILKEIDKCTVLCANCHRKLHWEEKQNILSL